MGNMRFSNDFNRIILFLGVALSLPIPSQSRDLLQECRTTDDSHVTRGEFTCCSSSPRSIPLISSLEFVESWEGCAVEPTHGNEDPVISAWRVYRCIVFKKLSPNSLKPSTFAEIMTEKYPVLIKTKVLNKMGKLEEQDMKFELDDECERRTPYPKVQVLRNFFYDIEQEVCEFSSSSYSPYSSPKNSSVFNLLPKNFSSIHYSIRGTSSSSSNSFAYLISSSLCEPCDRRRELYHRNGDCCSQVSIPFPFIYLPFRYGNQDRVENCVNNFIDDVGLPSDTTFANQLKYLCYPSCEYYLSGIISEDGIWAGAEGLLTSQNQLRNLIRAMMPKYFAVKYKREIERFVVSNFRNAWQETKTFESRIQPSQRDLRNCDKGKLKNLLGTCKAHRLVETVMNLYLNALCQEEYGNIMTTTTSGSDPWFNSSGEGDEGNWDWLDPRKTPHFSTTSSSRHRYNRK
ncbi:unnamed protein product [Orchesella dallaii]|uniref:Uncharacterized protein n=1 Tax=Orchesella dallaii TaxID=48710 RepID=A0ABP1S1P3_9HEXA